MCNKTKSLGSYLQVLSPAVTNIESILDYIAK